MNSLCNAYRPPIIIITIASHITPKATKNHLKATDMHQATSQHEYFTKYLSPANPIISKRLQKQKYNQQQLKLALRIQQAAKQDEKQGKRGKNANEVVEQEELDQGDEYVDRLTLINGYANKSMVYRKCDNADYRLRDKREYFASIFTNLLDWPQQKPYTIQCNGLRFSSQSQSMNLFAVFQTGPNQFDLVLQNDINTSGYTQWFYFSVSNRAKFQNVRFNIVNLYKAKSLYGDGMKPLILSRKSNKGWQRGGSNVFYGDNQINVQGSRKFYRTLSFEYTFLQQNNQTLFAHCYPYTYTNLKQKLKTLQKHQRIKIRYMGQTCMKKQIPILQFSQQDSNQQNKKAIIIMARQHPGQTVGSLVMDQILSELAKASNQSQFLLWRFNVYCIPMVNVDGVVLGNYRGNAFGYDLNRCWDRDNPVKLPEISHIKKEIRKIQKKYPIQMILDLHGHSRKMGSFFYGNPFGKYTGLFAYVASNMSPSISLSDSTFNKQKSQKITTARIILGNLIKDSGCFYTYQISFYGSVLNSKKVHFGMQNFQQLGKILVNSCYKTFVQLYKQEKTMKQSLYLKQARKQINIIQQNNYEQKSGSDSEAQFQTMKQMKVKSQQQSSKSPLKKKKSQNAGMDKNCQEVQNQKRSIEIQVGDSKLGFIDEEEKQELELANQKKQSTRNQKRILKLGSVSQKYSLYVGFQRSQQLNQIPNKNPLTNPNDRKNYLLQKLRVFGQTFIDPQKQTSKETQTGNFPLNIQCLNKKVICSPSEDQAVKSPQYRKKKNRNKSLIIRLDNKQKLAMADIVKVNRLEYKRIQRNSLIENHRKEIQLNYSKNILPNINESTK